MSIEAATGSNMWEIAAIVVLALWTIGCSTPHSEQLREWERHERKANLLVFAHGFNSSRDEAWGPFIPLIKADKAFDEYDILSYGYPQQVCFQTNDIRDVGAQLKSELTAELPNYDTTIFVGHSMGGLVVLHALLELGGSNAELISNKRLRVMSLGTPYYGATMASIFGPYCPNSQAEAMKVLSKESARLMQDWRQRSKIPVFPFYGGLEDKVVSQASACGIAPEICESVDGDHSSIAKPPDQKHLTYKKLQSMNTANLSKTHRVSRFTVLETFHNEAVRDNETGLVWEQSPAATAVSWYVARNTCPNKNVGGRYGWRLPSFTELATLIDPAATNHAIPALPLGHPFTNVQTFGYWSATTPSNPTNVPVAYVVFFTSQKGSNAVGPVGITDGTKAFAWCVHGPMNTDKY